MKKLLLTFFLLSLIPLSSCSFLGGVVMKVQGKEIDREEEYYIGRAVTANLIDKYGVYEDVELNEYVNLIGYTLSHVSDRPNTIPGYHIVVLNTNKVNAYSGPEGFVMITKGAIKRAENEEELAGIIAHEIAHTTERHAKETVQEIVGAEFIKKGISFAAQFSDIELAQRADIFMKAADGTVSKIVESGYSISKEHEADKIGTLLLARAGYNPRGIINYLKKFPKESKKLFGTHGSPESRIAELEDIINDQNLKGKTNEIRTERFKRYTSGIR